MSINLLRSLRLTSSIPTHRSSLSHFYLSTATFATMSRRSARTALQPTAANLAPQSTSPPPAEPVKAEYPPKAAIMAALMTPEDDEELTPPPSSPVSQREEAVDEAAEKVVNKRKRAVKAKEPREEEQYEEESELEEKPKPKKRATKKKAVKTEDEGEGGEQEDKPKKKTPKKSRIAKDEPEYDEDGNEIVKKKRKARVYPKKVYEIPDVERKTTHFKGRLGYACLNTVLRGNKPDSIFCSRTCRIASIEEEGMELPKGLAMMNVRDLKTMIQWNEDNNIRFMRMSSEMFPFASHAKYGYDLAFAGEALKEAGDLAKQYGHRLTMHPGQFTQLGSPKKAVIDSSIRELEYQCEIMDRMGLDQDGVMIIHMGGVYGDKESTLARFKENFTTRLPRNVGNRLVLENDEICYNVDDIFPLCEELSIPIIFDYHHDSINPSSSPPSVLIPKIAELWKKRGIKMKQHLSEQRPGAVSVMERRAHSDRCQNLPEELPEDVDLMIEAKDKEQAVFELYRIYGLEDVIHDNLRPPDPSPSMHTKGRKSNLKKKIKETGEVDSQGEPVQLTEIEKEGDGGEGVDATLPAAEDPGMEVDGLEMEGEGDVKPKKKRAPKAKKEEAVEEKGEKPKANKKGTKVGAEKTGDEGEKPPPKKRGRAKKNETPVKAEE
ncbi:UV damage endonuclease UvdE, variant [Cryptococcus amylolentus CBS 6039]|uniref:UV damage endonuclease UvdE, variant n=2 Tax=Cryptococcus amylolentus TaxID=104669 RepID=A0A1E3HDS0_9TREE|nr:UV damage endonuclease UvdE, variant [Cryptococcus amylolentus CBS 6039]ODN74488.1 UV damage endonuclease UvdE, variant [Cryptococcus amylolentus CBS 6039]